MSNPSELWSHAFDRQLSEESRHLLFTLASFGEGVCLEHLREAFLQFFMARVRIYGIPSRPQCFENALNECEDSFLRIGRSKVGTVVAFHNPSIREFVTRRVLATSTTCRDLIENAVLFEQIESFERLLSSDLAKPALTREHQDGGRIIGASILRTFESKPAGLSQSRFGNNREWSRQWHSPGDD